jgi:hypothetical protein
VGALRVSKGAGASGLVEGGERTWVQAERRRLREEGGGADRRDRLVSEPAQARE